MKRNSVLRTVACTHVAALCWCVEVRAQTKATNPVIYADVPDIAILRVGDSYYMSSTTMHTNPGVPIMKSKDLVNWDIVSYCYDNLSTSDGYSLNNGKSEYGHGSWASSIRYVNGTYYVSTFANTGKIYIYKTKNIETGPWTVSTLNAAYHDCNLFFDDDGKVYLIYGNGNISIIELTADASAIKAGGLNKVLISNAAALAGPIGLNAEGSQVVKHNGYYYINNICWPSGGMRTQILHRSKTIGGTYEGKVILKDQGVAQGSFIETPEGKWFAYLFRDFGAVGRIPYLVPMTWGADDWPVLSAVPTTLDIAAGNQGLRSHNLVASDEFTNTTSLKFAWQWNHAPQANYWSLTKNPGYMRLITDRTDPNALMTHNTLTQRTFGPTSCAYTKVDVSGMKDGDYAGMIALQKQYGYIGVKMSGTSKSIVMVTGDDITGTPTEKTLATLTQNTVYLRVDMNFTNRTDKATFFYSLNGTSWTSAGTTLQMAYTIPHFMGYRFGLFNYATKTAGGYADFDFYRVGVSISDIFPEQTTTSAPVVAITAPVATDAFVAPATINIAATATDADGTVSKVEFYNGTSKLGEDATSPYTYSWTNVAAGTYSITAVATDNAGNKTTSTAVSVKVNVPQAAYGGTPWPIPGKIEFESYDEGGNGFAYLDNTAGNIGGATTYRTTEDVDVEACTDTSTGSATAGTGYNVGYVTAGEWMEYTVNVAKAGKYDLALRVACNGDGRTVSISAKDVVVAKDVAIPNTAGWQTWKDVVVKDIVLDEGVQILRVTIGASDYVNLNYMSFAAQPVVLPSVSLKAGWNLIGCPIDGSTDIAKALSSIWANVETVKNLDSFYSVANNPAFNSLTKLEWGMGYMVKVTKNCELEWTVKQ